MREPNSRRFASSRVFVGLCDEAVERARFALLPETPRGGFEPPTTRLEGACSIQLSYRGGLSCGMVSEGFLVSGEKSDGSVAGGASAAAAFFPGGDGMSP